MGGSQVKTADSAAQIKMVKRHLEQWSEAWLLVFDNYDEPKKFTEVEQFIPTSRSFLMMYVGALLIPGRGLRSRTLHQPQPRSRSTWHASGNPTDDDG